MCVYVTQVWINSYSLGNRFQEIDLRNFVLHRSDLYQSVTNSIFYWLMRGLHTTLTTGVACWQGTLIPPDTRSRPSWDLYMFYLLLQIFFPELVVIFPDYAIRIFIGTFSILLYWGRIFLSLYISYLSLHKHTFDLIVVTSYWCCWGMGLRGGWLGPTRKCAV